MSTPPSPVAPERVLHLNGRPRRAGADGARHVLYWMTATRRTRSNLALQHALDLARSAGLPLVVLEALASAHPHATARVAQWVVDGMQDNLAACSAAVDAAPVGSLRYLAYLEQTPGAGRGLVEALARDAAVVVGDAYPTYFLPAVHRALGQRIGCALELVDSATLVPMSTAPKGFARAHDLRRFLHARLPEELERAPLADPLGELAPSLPAGDPDAPWAHLGPALEPWPLLFDTERERAADPERSRRAMAGLRFPVDVQPTGERGGAVAAGQRLARFLDAELAGYADSRGKLGTTSGLSPALHFGNLGPHEVLAELLEREPWHPEEHHPEHRGKRAGWWGLSPDAEGWLDQLVTWRELGWNHCLHDPDHARFAGLPPWARTTLAEHAGDERPWTYSREQLEAAATHDEIWNAAQRQLVREGRIHNYLRMLWGKLILEWSASPEEAFETAVHLNDRYALDGRDPNSYTAIAWVFGKFDRPWGPERPVFGKVRCMTSASTRRKLKLEAYLEQFAPSQAGGLFELR